MSRKKGLPMICDKHTSRSYFDTYLKCDTDDICECGSKTSSRYPMPSRKGKTHTKETKEKMSASAHRRRIERIGIPKQSYKGIFSPKFPQKYKGDVSKIIWRSTWELRVMKWLDMNINVIEWNSEEVVIPYFDPTKGKYRRYFPDFVIRVRLPDNRIKTYMLEVKPLYQTKEPQKKKRVTKKYINEVTAWSTNEAKWNQAKEYCADRGWEFKLITEKELGL